MKASERIKLYEWLNSNKENIGKPYPKILIVDYLDYDCIRAYIHRKGGSYEILKDQSVKRGKKRMRIYAGKK